MILCPHVDIFHSAVEKVQIKIMILKVVVIVLGLKKLIVKQLKTFVMGVELKENSCEA